MVKMNLKELLRLLLTYIWVPQSVGARFIISVASGSGIYAYKIGRIIFVSGYVRPTNTVAFNAQIGTIDSQVMFETFASPSDNVGGTGRMVIRENGALCVEKELTAGRWYSFSFTVITK